MPDGVSFIGSWTFRNCTSLTSITIPDSVTFIGDYAFYYCSSLTSINIPVKVTSIGDWAFGGCTFEGVYYNGTASEWASISFGSYSPTSNPLQYAENLYLNGTLATDITLEGITTINTYAFYGYSSLKSVTIGDGVTSIGSSAFYNCTSLESIYYSGTADDWSAITFGDSSYSDPTYYGATLYYYSEEKPDFTDGYNYWHYVDGEVVIWTVEAE